MQRTTFLYALSETLLHQTRVSYLILLMWKGTSVANSTSSPISREQIKTKDKINRHSPIPGGWPDGHGMRLGLLPPKLSNSIPSASNIWGHLTPAHKRVKWLRDEL